MTFFVHPKGVCESDNVGDGTRIWAFAHVLPGAKIGEDCNICDHVFIEGGAVVGDRVTVKNAVLIWDGVTVEDDAFIGPGVVFTNDRRPRSDNRKFVAVPTRVRLGASLGASVTVACGVEIGAYALVGAGSLVTRDVPAHALMMGGPAVQSGWVCCCGESLSDSLECQCGRCFVATPTGIEQS